MNAPTTFPRPRWSRANKDGDRWMKLRDGTGARVFPEARGVWCWSVWLPQPQGQPTSGPLNREPEGGGPATSEIDAKAKAEAFAAAGWPAFHRDQITVEWLKIERAEDILWAADVPIDRPDNSDIARSGTPGRLELYERIALVIRQRDEARRELEQLRRRPADGRLCVVDGGAR